MGVTTQIQIATGAGPSLTSIDGGTFTFNRADSATDTTTPIPIPTSTGNKHSWLKYVLLANTTTGSTTISNLRIATSGALPTGLKIYYVGQSTYTQANTTQGGAGGNYPPDDSNAAGTQPTNITWTGAVTTSPAVYDATGGSTGSTGRIGKYCQLVAQVGSNYDSSANVDLAHTALSNVQILYDEA